jgi:hypothetical protein
MRINVDCVRDIMLCSESNTGLRSCCVFIDTELSASIAPHLGELPKEPSDYQSELNQKWDNETLIYHVRYCIDADLLRVVGTPTDEYVISDLTPKGHSFIENIREPKNWRSVKGVAEKVGSKSLEAIVQIASNVISDVVKVQLGIT